MRPSAAGSWLAGAFLSGKEVCMSVSPEVVDADNAPVAVNDGRRGEIHDAPKPLGEVGRKEVLRVQALEHAPSDVEVAQQRLDHARHLVHGTVLRTF
jgi:hypothetical protein